jgi:hypothetical protein
MISQLASPSVCILDDDVEDYRPLLNVLNDLHIGYVHVLGKDTTELPISPFNNLRLIFTDLHLSTFTGRDAASHFAQVFSRVVSQEGKLPILVIIWSKYASDSVPEDDQETESEMFKRTLLEAFPKYKDYLIFKEMPKLQVVDRTNQWPDILKENINQALQNRDGLRIFWSWESLVRKTCISVNAEINALAQKNGMNTIDDSQLKIIFQSLVHAQGQGDLSEITSPDYLINALSQLLMDKLEHSNKKIFSTQGSWLAQSPPRNQETTNYQMNGFLLTSAISEDSVPFLPGTVYNINPPDNFLSCNFGLKRKDFVQEFFDKDRSFNDWRRKVKTILIEVSPACDVAQGKRKNAFLVAGLIVPKEAYKKLQSKDAFVRFPAFFLRWSMSNFAKQDAVLVFCSRYKLTLPAKRIPSELQPWFRLRELPTTALRNSYTSYASRVGYVYL